MAKVDLHVHSKFSNHPTEWFLQRLGAAESYTEPEFIYKTAKERGMSFVTITDHNRIEGSVQLKASHPEDVFIGTEATAYFPEDGCKIHILLFGLTENEFQEVQKFRKNIYDLREYIKEKNMAHSVAHATFFVNNKLRLEHLEKLILLFDVFEGINGGRNRINNETWMATLAGLSPDRILDLFRKYKIEPIGNSPWMKSSTGGSDDHSGLFIGRTYTLAKAETAEEFLDQLRAKQTQAEGRHNDYQSLTFTFYKIGYDFSKSKSSPQSQSLISQVTENLFEKRSPTFKSWIEAKKIKSLHKKNQDKITGKFLDLMETLRQDENRPLEEKLDIVYDKLAAISDEFFKTLLQSFERDILRADLVSLVKNISSSLPGIFLSVPFFSTLKHMFRGRHLINELIAGYCPKNVSRPKKILWFTDTLTDLNGVAVTLRKIGWLAHKQKKNITIVTSLSPEEYSSDLPPNILNLPYLQKFPLPSYEKYTLKIPSLLTSLKKIYHCEPDLVYVSTPGPIGFLGLIVSRIFNVKSVGIYHTDFALQSKEIIGDESVVEMLESYTKWFYSAMDEILVPTREYIHLLANRGFELSKMKVFRRGVDSELFAPRLKGREYLEKTFEIKKGIHLLYAGRISQDKNLDFLLEVYKRIVRKNPCVNLIFAGDGPYLATLKERANGLERVIFTGALKHELMPDIYSGADIFVFPSSTDTFGMAVIEAQACGLPAIVSNLGGPQEIIKNGITGYVVSTNRIIDWQDEIEQLIELKIKNPKRFLAMKEAARNNALHDSSWDAVLREIAGETMGQEKQNSDGEGLDYLPSNLFYASI